MYVYKQPIIIMDGRSSTQGEQSKLENWKWGLKFYVINGPVGHTIKHGLWHQGIIHVHVDQLGP